MKYRSFWNELDDNLIYYQNDNSHYFYLDYSHLRIRNI